MTDHSDLVARLRTQSATVHSGAYHVMHEAAALIETQAAELERLREALAKYDEPMSCLTSAERGEALADAVRAALTDGGRNG